MRRSIGAIDEHVEAAMVERAPIAFDEAALGDRFAGASVLVTGAGGSIGSRLVELVAELGAREIVCLEHHEPSLFRLGLRLRELYPDVAIRLVLGDVRDRERLARLLDEGAIDCIFQMAAYKHVPLAEENCDQVAAVNLLAPLEIVDRAAAAGVRDVVYPSTDKAVRPPSIYGATKRLAELELMRRARERPAPRLGICRLVNVFGTAGNVIEVFANQLALGKPLTVTDPLMTRYYITTREAVRLLASAACLDRPLHPLMVPVGERIPLTRIASHLAEILTGEAAEIRVTGARPGERRHEELTYSFERLEPTALAGIFETRAQVPLPDMRPTIERLRRSVERGDNAATRGILAATAEAAVLA